MDKDLNENAAAAAALVARVHQLENGKLTILHIYVCVWVSLEPSFSRIKHHLSQLLVCSLLVRSRIIAILRCLYTY